MSENTKRSVLIAEDNKVLGDVLRFNLERGGFQVTLARSGDAAAKLFSADTYDLLITDVQMPGLSGLELCEWIRCELGNTSLPIIICSARGFELNEAELRHKYGLVELIFKPFSVRDVIAKANRLLSNQPAASANALEATPFT